MSTGGNALGGALKKLGGGAPVSLFPSGEQLDLIADGGVAGSDGLARLREARRRSGRPPGATNKRNAKVAQWFINKYGDPLSAAGEIMAMAPDQLMLLLRELQGGDAKHKPLRAIDVIRLKLDAAAVAAPYVHGKQPVTVEVTGKRDAIIVMQGMAPTGTELPPEEAEQLIEQYGMAAFEQGTLRVLPRDRIEDAEWDEPEADDSDETGGEAA